MSKERRNGVAAQARMARLGGLIVAAPERMAQLRRECEAKVSYRSRAEAKHGARRLRKLAGSGDEYICPHCGLWHVTKVPPDRYRARRREEGGAP